MTIADDNENPKAGKRPDKPLDAMTALRIAMEQRLAEDMKLRANAAPPQRQAPEPAPVVPDMAAAMASSARAADNASADAAQAEQAETHARPKAQPKDAQDRPHDWTRILMRIAEHNQRLLQDFTARNKDMAREAPLSFMPREISQAFLMLTNRLLQDPERYAEAQINLWKGYLSIWQTALARMNGETVEPVIKPAPTDKRFQDKEWQSNWLFDFLKQSYLLTSSWAQHLIRQESRDIDPKLARKLDFYAKQMCDAISPSNFWLTNPEVLRTTLASGGENLMKGFENLLSDFERGHGQLRISMSNVNAFKVGPDTGEDKHDGKVTHLATTPGKVIYQNEIMQLIQYAPSTPMVHRTPLLIMSPWINKFYILDLSPKKSYIRYLVGKGYTVFCISWVNPDAKLAAIGFDDYMSLGTLAAMREIRRATGEDSINIVGYCIGGTLLASTLAYLNAAPEEAKAGLPAVNSATYLVTMTDFSEPGDLGVFIDDEQITSIEEHMTQLGFLDAASMATTFNMLRANDLIWSFVVNNYLLGKEPFPFDILYWNADSTNLPAEMHSYYLREMYLHNRLIRPNMLEMKNVPIDLGSITVPSFMLSTSEDHIAPWRSTYAATQIYRGPVTFMLSGSGHIAGIVNPPEAGKYCYWTNNALPETADAWLDQAERHEGSWWPAWLAWLEPHAGEMVAARQVNDGIEDAPGSYVKIMAV